MTRPKIYASKIDTWLVAVSLSCAFAALTSLVTASHIGTMGMTAFVGLLACTVLGLLAWVLLGTNYRFDGAMLIICSGPFRWRIPVREILSIEQSRNPLSSPALSLDRLCIQYGAPRRIILVSPRDREGFMQEFERCKGR
jgi:PH (Pleckstrin Homology) domain-containing protein